MKQKLRYDRLAILVIGCVLVLALVIWAITAMISGFTTSKTISDAQSEQDTNMTTEVLDDENNEIQQAIAPIVALNAMDAADLNGLSDEQIRACFYSSELSEDLINKLNRDLFDTNQDFVAPSDLRLVRILYTDFEGTDRVGELIVNQAISDDIESIFYTLWQNDYPIDKVAIPYGYGDNDEASMTDDYTRSLAFTWEDGVAQEHEHSLGLAIDLNPLYNPQVITEGDEVTVLPAAGAAYADRSEIGPHMIAEDDLAVYVFRSYGFYWGGTWEGRNDYQHFEKYFNHDTNELDLNEQYVAS